MCLNSVQVTVLVELGSVSFLTENLRMASDKSENCLGWAARDESGVLSPYEFNRRYMCILMIPISHVG